MFPGAHLAGNRNFASVSFSFFIGYFSPNPSLLDDLPKFLSGKTGKAWPH